MTPGAAGGAVLERFLPDGQATEKLGQDVAMALRPGDLLALSGDLGAGKTTLARGLIGALADDPSIDVPSPTFTLLQSYDLRVPVHHVDLYRLAAPDELDELGLDEALADGAVLVEWPERAGDRLPGDAVRIEITHENAGRLAKISGAGATLDRIARSLAMRDFLRLSGWGEAERRYFTGDASARSYETVTLPDESARVLMNALPLVLGPPVRDGKPYAEIARSARTVAAFVALDRALRSAGICAPEIFAQDLAQGFLLIEHLGAASFLDAGGRPVAQRYAAAAELLASMHELSWSHRLEAAPGIIHEVPPFDRAAMMIEADLLINWYFPFVTGSQPADDVRAGFHDAWNVALNRLDSAEKTLMLRDFHSPNIIWREDRVGHDRLGVIDFQDALIGPAAYDLASLAMDARVTIPPEIEQSTVEAYKRARRAQKPFDEAAFAEAYAIMAAQRNSKILGIFVRLDRRDGKPAYLQHLPRIRDYLARALDHPALGELRGFYRANGLLGD